MKAVYGFDPQLCTHPPTWDAFDDACRKGTRWHEIHESIELPVAFRPALYNGNHQSWFITSSGPNGAGFVRGFSGGAMVDWDDGEPQFTMRDLNLASAGLPGVGLRVSHSFLSVIERVKVDKPGGNGIELIGPECNAITVILPTIHDAGGIGVLVDGATDVTLLRPNVERCRDRGLLWLEPQGTPPPNDHVTFSRKGGVCMFGHFEQNGLDLDGQNIRVENASVTLRDNDLYGGHFQFAADPDRKLCVRDNRLVDSLLIGDPTGHDVGNNSVVFWKNTRPPDYVVPETPPRVTYADPPGFWTVRIPKPAWMR